MTRAQRRIHAIAWALALPAILVMLYALVRARPADRFTPPQGQASAIEEAAP